MKNRNHWNSFLIVQLIAFTAIGAAFIFSNAEATTRLQSQITKQPVFKPVPISRKKPLRIAPLYNRPDIVSDADLAAVLDQIKPRFAPEHMKPNHVEHALRTWSVRAKFREPGAVSGQTMLEFLTDHAAYVESWGEKMRPLLQDTPTGIHVRWGKATGASYHHDHLLACVTEAGAPLDTPVYGPARRDTTLYDVVQESLLDFRLDERETEWTAMAFGLWIAPEKNWRGADGRHYSFDLLVSRLMRGQKELGVCSGTHRVYSLMMLIRLDDEFDILSDEARADAYGYLENVRDAIVECQFEDGHWPSNWPDGKAALDDPVKEDLYKQVIATGHHLEWLSIAPKDLHPPEEMIKKAADWVVATTKAQTREEIAQRYTFFSHVGAALANWRSTHPAEFWMEWEANHPAE